MRELLFPGTLVLLPGMCMSCELFGPQREAFGDDVFCPHWISPQPREGIASYAQRWAQPINAALRRRKQPVFLGGASFGGMIAMELARHLDPAPEAVFLIGSARSPQGVPGHVKTISRLLASRSPAAARRFVGWVSVPLALREGLDDRGFSLVTRMARGIDPEMAKWSLGAAGEWVWQSPVKENDPPVYQLHGRKDWILPLRRQSADQVVENGRHLLNLTHAHTVNRFMFDHAVARVDRPDPETQRVEDPHLTAQRRAALEAT